MTPAPDTDRTDPKGDGLREFRNALTFACNDPGHFVGFRGDRSLGEWQADALLSGPLAQLRSDLRAAEAERDEARQALEQAWLTHNAALLFKRDRDAAEAERDILRTRVEEAEKAEARTGTDYADAMNARMEDALLIENLRIAFLVLAESGHGGGMAEVRRWFAAGAAGPIPWPGGKLFEVWAAEHDIYDCNGVMGFRRGDRGRAA